MLCSVCGLDKWKSDFCRRDRNRDFRLCKPCRNARDKEKTEQDKAELASGRKHCNACDQYLPLDDFTFHIRGVYGRSPQCKVCRAKYLASYRAKMSQSLGNGKFGNPTDGYICSICKEQKPINEFVKSSKHFDYRCKRCAAYRADRYRKTTRGTYKAAKTIARRRKMSWKIRFAEYASLRNRPCHYCGFRLPRTGLGLDRIDNSKGYSADNVLPCCTECNLVRGSNFTVDEMMILGKAVRIIKNSRQRRGIPIDRSWGRPKKYAEPTHETPPSEPVLTDQ